MSTCGHSEPEFPEAQDSPFLETDTVTLWPPSPRAASPFTLTLPKPGQSLSLPIPPTLPGAPGSGEQRGCSLDDRDCCVARRIKGVRMEMDSGRLRDGWWAGPHQAHPFENLASSLDKSMPAQPGGTEPEAIGDGASSPLGLTPKNIPRDPPGVSPFLPLCGVGMWW